MGKLNKLILPLLVLSMTLGVFMAQPQTAHAANDKPYYTPGKGGFQHLGLADRFDDLYLASAYANMYNGIIRLERDHIEENGEWQWRDTYSGSEKAVNTLDLNGYNLTVYLSSSLFIPNGRTLFITGGGSVTFYSDSHALVVPRGASDVTPLIVGQGTTVTFSGGTAGGLIDASNSSKTISGLSAGNLYFEGKGNGSGLVIEGNNPNVIISTLNEFEANGSGTGHGIKFISNNINWASNAELTFLSVNSSTVSGIYGDALYLADPAAVAINANITNTHSAAGKGSLTFTSSRGNGIYAGGNLTFGGNRPVDVHGDKAGLYQYGTTARTITANTELYVSGESPNAAGIHISGASGLTLAGTGPITAEGISAGLRFDSTANTTLTNNTTSAMAVKIRGTGDSSSGVEGDGIRTPTMNFTVTGTMRTNAYATNGAALNFTNTAGHARLTVNQSGSSTAKGLWLFGREKAGTYGDGIRVAAPTLYLEGNAMIYADGENGVNMTGGQTQTIYVDNTDEVFAYGRQSGIYKYYSGAGNGTLNIRGSGNLTLNSASNYGVEAANCNLNIYDVSISVDAAKGIYAGRNLNVYNAAITAASNPAIKAGQRASIMYGSTVKSSGSGSAVESGSGGVYVSGGALVEATGTGNAITTQAAASPNADITVEGTVRATGGGSAIVANNIMEVVANGRVEASGAGSAIRASGGTYVNVYGGTVEAHGTGDAIYADATAGDIWIWDVTEEGHFPLVRAKTGYAINASKAGSVRLEAGTAFAYGSNVVATGGVINPACGFTAPTWQGAAIAWANKATPITYVHGEITDLKWLPLSGDAEWDKSFNGIAYDFGMNNGAITINGVSVTAPSYSMSVSAPSELIPWPVPGQITQYLFKKERQGYSPVTPTVFTLKNTGTGQITGISARLAASVPGIPFYGNVNDFVLTQTPVNTLAAGASTTFTIKPKDGLTPGYYSVIVAVDSSLGAGHYFSLSFSVVSAATPLVPELLLIGPEGMLDDYMTLPHVKEGYAPVSPVTYTLRNIGTGTCSKLLVNPVNDPAYYMMDKDKFIINTSMTAGALAPGDMTTFTIRPVDNLPNGAYYARVDFDDRAGSGYYYYSYTEFNVFPANYSGTFSMITVNAIPGVTPPVAGAVPVTNISASQYTAIVSWNPSHATFQGGTTYTANISVIARPGYTFYGLPAGFFTVAGASSVTHLANSTQVTAYFPPTAGATPITIKAIGGLTPPVAGASPVYSITPTAQYTGTVTWSPNVNPFGYSTSYTATVTLQPQQGYTYAGLQSNFFTVANASSVTFNNTNGTLNVVFPATGPDPVLTINMMTITGVIPPAAGAAPVSTITETAQYTGTVSWTPNDSLFNYGKEYTARITIMPKPGYKLEGVKANTFQLAGANSVTNAENSGVVTAVFPKTASSANLSFKAQELRDPDGSGATVAILLNFDKHVFGFSDTCVTVTNGTGNVTVGEIGSSGATGFIIIENVAKAGTVLVRVNNFGPYTVTTGQQTVTVYAGSSAKPGDLNNDGVVDALDLAILLANFGKSGATPAMGDLNNDGKVDAADLSLLISNYGR